MNETQQNFERRRLELFREYGTEMEPRHVEDRHGRTTYLLDSGGEGPQMLMVHGTMADGSIWAPIASYFTASHRVLVVDCPGCGLSFSIDYGDADYRRTVTEWFADIVDELGSNEVDVVANSMGGYIALAYAISDDHERTIDRLALVGAPAGLDRWLPFPMRLMGLKGFNRLLFKIMGDPDVDDVRDFYEQLVVADADRLDRSYLEVASLAQSLPGAEKGDRTQLEECTSLGGFRREYMLREEVPSLSLPMLFVWGEEDAFAEPESGQELAEQMDNAGLVRVPDAGHLPWLDHADQTVSPIREFLGAS